MEKAYAAPNAPEWPDKVVHLEPEQTGRKKDHVQETVVAGTE